MTTPSTHPPSGPSTPPPPPGPSPKASLVDAARAWGRVAIALAELTVSIARRRAL